MSIHTPTVDEAGYAPGPDLAARLDVALGTIGAPELAGLILTAGLATVYEQLQRTRKLLGDGVGNEIALHRDKAHLISEARRWKSRWKGAVAQARKEHARADALARTCPPECAKAHLYDGACLLDPMLVAVIAYYGSGGEYPGWSWSCSTDEGCGILSLSHSSAAAARRSYERHLQSATHQEYAAEAGMTAHFTTLRQENERLRGRLAAEELANEELRGERADLRLALSEFEGAKARAAATEATEPLSPPALFSPAMLRQAASAIADAADRGDKTGVVRIYLRDLARKLRQVAEGREAYEQEQDTDG
ncbi:hypothetical protein [Streptacidiphilus rugosus]|uniref:hypothetical protein n=1 Tax=Streptacidiphilus rugosus TaxID=405783 RepID=UPI00056B60C3|nr:hypothetical protein [Streptacidiphilus rugosus]